MNIPPIASLEIGSSRTVVLVGEAEADGRMRVVGKGVNVSTGVRKGQITTFENATHGIAQAVKQAVDESRIDIGRVLVAASGGYIASLVNPASAPVRSRDHVVSAEDVEEVQDLARNVTLPTPTCATMHSIPQKYRLDGQSGIVRPEGLKGSTLSLNMFVIYAESGPVENLRRAAAAASLDVDDVAFSALCASLAVLTPSQKAAGVAVVDLGGGTTNYVAYVDGVPAAAGSLAVGGDHVTNDIALAFNMPQTRAEDLKREFGHALVGGGSERIPLPADFGLRDRTVSLKALRTVVNARIDETLRIILAKLAREDVLAKLGAGIVFTGGGASLPGLVELAQNIFGVPCMIGAPRNVLGLESVEAPHSFAVSAGLLLYGLRAYEQEHGRRGGFLETLKRSFGI